ncbi:MAG: hypothetical protein D4R65_14025, partial [Verrucomicrobiaceae bacterium]
MKHLNLAPATPPLEIGSSLLVIGHSSDLEKTEYPTPNTEYPIMKDRAAASAIPPLEIGSSLLVIGHSSDLEKTEYPTPNTEYPI